MKNGFIIAIDGPAAAGKGTVAPVLASKLHGYHLYTGSMYRCVTLYCLIHAIDITDEKKVVDALGDIAIAFKDDRYFLNGDDVTKRIRERDIDTAVSTIADYQGVRHAMISQQQYIGKEKTQNGAIVIAEGRDTATKVFPDAEVKIYLTAKPEVRAKRRLKQLQERGLVNATFEEILKETIVRDEQDMYGNLGYLVSDPAKYGYDIIDDTDKTEEQTIDAILAVLKKKKLL